MCEKKLAVGVYVEQVEELVGERVLGALVHAGRHERLVAGAELAIGDVAARTLELELLVPALAIHRTSRHVLSRTRPSLLRSLAVLTNILNFSLQLKLPLI